MIILAKTKRTLKAVSRNKLELWAAESLLSAGSRQVFVRRIEKPSPGPEQSLEVISWSQLEAASMEVLFPLAERENGRKRFHWSAFWTWSWALNMQRSLSSASMLWIRTHFNNTLFCSRKQPVLIGGGGTGGCSPELTDVNANKEWLENPNKSRAAE